MANENVPGEVVEALRAHGHDVRWVRTDMPAASDKAVLAESAADERVVVTFDKDFGELAFRSRLPAACGIILFRLRLRSPAYAVKRVLGILQQRSDWQGHFSVADESQIRMTPMPGTSRRGM